MDYDNIKLIFAFIIALFSTFIFYILRKKSRYILIILKTFPRDLQLIYRTLKTEIFITYCIWRDYTILHFFYFNYKKRPYDVAFIGIDGREYTFKQFEDESNKIATYFENQGYKAGDCVGLMMESTPEYVLCWYALGKIRVITSFLNTNLMRDQLMHCINISKCNGIIFNKPLERQISELNIPSIKLFSYDGTTSITNAINLQEAISEIEAIDIYPRAKCHDVLTHIFTSGTTGLPKAITVKHLKVFHFAHGGLMCDFCKSDRLYTFMPLYHANSGLLMVSSAFIYGCTLVIRKKFSASNFANDCIKYRINVFNYIGEVCRYLCNSKPNENDKLVNIKIAVGNGMRKNVWTQLKEKFKIEQIVEFYGSSEGNVSAINLCGKVGACGYYPVFLSKYLFFCIVKCDEDGDIIFDTQNHAILCDENEIGHLIGKIMRVFVFTRFDGYIDKSATNKKIASNLFKTGDKYYLSGDLFTMDEYGYLYFYDRIGETYRWKGENVSTNELETYFQKFPQIIDALVYGVSVPGNEGKAGMLSVSLNCPFNPKDFEEYIQGLPSYQRPVFIRVIEKAAMTETMKYIKKDLKKSAYDIHQISDPIFINIPNIGYTRLTEQIYQELLESKLLS